VARHCLVSYRRAIAMASLKVGARMSIGSLGGGSSIRGHPELAPRDRVGEIEPRFGLEVARISWLGAGERAQLIDQRLDALDLLHPQLPALADNRGEHATQLGAPDLESRPKYTVGDGVTRTKR
jgi:hypothetical protein